jgi:REP element-mobilizing transposase RayT
MTTPDGAIPNRAREEAAQAPFTSTDGPLAYLITFPTYGTWLHGDDRGSVDRDHNIPGTRLVPPNKTRRHYEQRRLRHDSIVLGAAARAVVQRTMSEVAEHRGWAVHAINVRRNHVHIVVSSDRSAERIMNDLKSWSTRRLIEAGIVAPGTRVWVRHGSTRYLWKPREVEAACQYVVEGQGADLPGAE